MTPTKEQTAVLRNRNGERGMALVIALLVMAALLVLGITFLSTSLTESNIASNEVNTSQAFQLADAGINHARIALMSLSPTGVLNGNNLGFAGAGGNTEDLGGGSYTVVVSNNVGANFPQGSIPADSSASNTNDDDRILVLESTGTFEGAQRVVEAIVEVGTTTPGAVYTMDGTDIPPAPVAEIEDLPPGTSISGNDCNPPSNTGGTAPPGGVHGIATQSTDARDDLIASAGASSAQITGPSGSGDIQVPSIPPMSSQDMEEWVNTLLAQATLAGTGDCGTETGGPGDPKNFGTWDNPQVCKVVGTGTEALSDFITNGSSGAGILIIDDFDLITPPLEGSTVTDFQYEGIVIVVGDGRFRMEGNSHIYGALIQRNVTANHSGETRLRLRGTSSICYSSLAVRRVQNTLTRGLMAWYEKASN